jgi:two-component system sensor histidine kinase HydH
MSSQRALDTNTLDEVVRSVPAILENLRNSYAELEARAQRMEHELRLANEERDEMVERLHAADKMAALGTMAAGIAHEIRNPLSAVKGFAALLQRRGDLDEEATRWCRLIVDGSSEADLIIENMLSFGSPQRMRLETIDGQELLESGVRLALAQENVSPTASVEARSNAPAFAGDRIKLRQTVRNLVVNALEAQQAYRPGAAARVEVTLAQEEGHIALRCVDAGPGVSPEDRHRIFDPFYTDHAEGTGLGLALVAAIARLHGGSIRVCPEPAVLGGAEFLFRFPYQPANQPTGVPATQRPS